MKMKYCGSGEHEVAKLWRAKTKTTPSACYDCARRQNPSPIKKVAVRDANEPIKPKKVYVIPKVSDKQKKINAAYAVLRKAFLKRKPHCEAQLRDCTYVATQCHHSKGRIGKNMLDDSTYVALCHNCHTLIENSPYMAKELGLSKNRLDKSA